MPTAKNKRRRKYNTSTGCYKIDVFLDGSYIWSTDWSKTCKAAKESACKLNPGIDPKRITAYFDYQ
jgi:hypothetical protein